jgi:hypothetical protein
MTKCSHNEYWKGHYGTCMICRAEKAEKLADRYIELLAIALRLEEIVDNNHENLKACKESYYDGELFKVTKQVLADFQDFKKRQGE